MKLKNLLLVFYALSLLSLLSLRVEAARNHEEKTEGREYESKEGFVVHEWGVILRKMEKGVWVTKTKPGDLPDFVQKFPIVNFDRVEALKPIVYFYGPKGHSFDLEIGCTRGAATFAWPFIEDVNKEIKGGNEEKMPEEGKPADSNDEDIKKDIEKKDAARLAAMRAVAKMRDIKENEAVYNLLWKNLQITGKQDAKDWKAVDKNHWFNTARDVSAPGISVNGTNEKFIFYEGDVTNHGFPVTSRKTADGAEIQNFGQHDIFDVFVVRVTDGKVSIAYLEELEGVKANSDEEIKRNMVMKKLIPMKVEEVAEGDVEKLTVLRLQELLEKAGLYTKEAKGMAKIWNEEFFKTEGTRVFYRMNQNEYDEIYPMKLSAKPDSIVRIMLNCFELQ